MKTRPILFSGPMVRALLNGSKTQTRRVVKARSDKNFGSRCVLQPHELAGEVNRGDYQNCPHGQPGDQLWVRESGLEHRTTQLFIHDATPGRWWTPKDGGRYGASYSADIPRSDFLRDHRVRPSIHMPRWASRITLEITGVRVERLQDISETDAVAEGVTPHGTGYARGWQVAGRGPISPDPVFAYRTLFESINGPGSWDENPWVWVLEFKRVLQ